MWISNLSNKMWPQFLDMTRDECRGVLRRLGNLLTILTKTSE